MTARRPQLRPFSVVVLATAVLVPLGAEAQQRPEDIEDRLPRREQLVPEPEPILPTVDASADESAAPPGESFVLAAVVFEGVTVFEAADLAPTYEAFLARPATTADMAAIADAVTRTYRDAGYALSRAVIPAQSGAGGVLRVRVVEGYVAAVAVNGTGGDAVARRFDPVLRERPLRLATLERALTLVDDLAGISIASSELMPDLDDLSVYRLVIQTSEDRFDGWAFADNRGVGPAGEAQGYISGSVNGLLRTGDRLSVGVFTALENPEDLAFAEVGYAVPINASGSTVSVYGSHSKSEAGSAGLLGVDAAESRRVLVQIAHPFVHGRSFTLRGDAGFELRSLQERRDGAMSFEDELRIVELGVNMLRSGSGVTTLDARLRAGLEAFGASSGGTGPLSRPDADGEFTQLRFYASHYRDIGERFGVYVAGNGQISSDPVLATEEFTFGGAQFGRAYDYAWLSGDDGAGAMFELRYGEDPGWAGLDFYQLYGFYDAGWAWNHEADGTSSYGQASSAGLGLRLTTPSNLRLGLEAAKPLTRRPGVTSDDDWRGFLSVSADF